MTAQPTLFDTPAGTIPTTRPGATGGDSWLTRHLIAAGHLTETGLGRRARIRTCPRCKSWILAGLDADTCAFEARTDPTPLTPLGEALAVIDNRRTWHLHRDGRGWLLDPRTADDITTRPATTRTREDVLRQHRCHTPPIAGPQAATTTFAEATPPLPPGSPAPF